jgi:hypothetical protein
VAALLEIRGHVFSDRFDYPSAFILAVCAIQLACAAVILIPRFAVWAAAVLSVTTVGAIASHIRIGSPDRAVPALLFTLLQLWYGIASTKR